MSKKGNKRYVKKEEPIIHVQFNMQAERIEIKNENDENEYLFEPFRGQTYCYYQKSFSKSHLNVIKSELMEEYINKHPNINEKKLQEISKLVDKNVNLNVYSVLKKYDNMCFWKNKNTNKADKYLKAMIKTFKRRPNESKKQYNLRVLEERQKMLNKAKINCDFKLDGILTSNSKFIDKIKVLKMLRKFKFTSNIIFHNKISSNAISSKEQKKTNFNATKDNFNSHKGKKIKLHNPAEKQKKLRNPIKKQVNKRFTAPKGFFNKLKDKVKESDFKLKTKKTLLLAGIISMSLLTATEPMLSNSPSRNDIPKRDGETETSIDLIIDDKKDNQDQSHIISETDTTEETDDLKDIKAEPEMVVLQDILFETINVPFNISFKGPEAGKYYSSPEGTGQYGYYDNKKENLYTTYIDVFDVDGAFYVYKIEDGKSISEIKALHPGATLSYCMYTESGMNLGWNPSTDNNIETQIMKGTIARLKPYLSQETMQFLCNNDLQSTVDKNQINTYLEELKLASEQEQSKQLTEQQNFYNVQFER